MSLRAKGRWRRRLLRGLLWSLALVALLGLGLRTLVGSAWAREEARQRIERLASDALATPVVVGALRFTLLPLTVRLDDVRVGGDPARGLPALVQVPRITIDADPRGLWRRDVRLDRVVVERPTVEAAFLADGSDNLPDPGGRNRGRAPVEVFVGQLVIDGAQVVVDRQRMELSIEAQDTHARWQGRGANRVAGEVSAEGIRVLLPDAAPLEGVAVHGTATLDADGLHFEQVATRGPDFDLTVDGRCTWREDRRCTIEVDGTSDGRLLAALGYFEDLAGPLAVDGSVEWRTGSLGMRGRFRGTALTLFDRRLDDVEGVVIADRQGIRLALERGRYAEGTLVGTAAYDHTAEDRPVTVELDVHGARLRDVLRDQGVDIPNLGGRLEGAVRYRFARRAPRRGAGGGELAIVPDPPDDPPAPVLLVGDVPIRIDDGVIASEAIAVQSSSQSLLARGRYDLTSRQGTFDYEVASRDVAALTSLLPFEAGEETVWRPTAGTGTIEGQLTWSADAGLVSDLRLTLDDVVAGALPGPQRVVGVMRAAPEGLSDVRLEIGDAAQALLVAGAVPFAVPLEPTAETDGDPGSASPSPLALIVDAVDWPLDAVQPWLDFRLPLAGRISGRLALEGTRARTRGDLEARVAPVQWRLADGRTAGPPVDALAGRLHWDGEAVRFPSLTLTSAAGALHAEGEVGRDGGGIEVALEGRGLQLAAAPFDAYRPRDDLEGAVSVRARLGGTLTAPTLAADLDVGQLRMGERSLGTGTATTRWDGRRLHLDATLPGAIVVRGGGALDERQADLRFDWAAGDLATIAGVAALDAPADLEGAADGVLEIRGPLLGGLPPAVVTIETFEARAGDRALTAQVPAVVRLTTDGFEVATLAIGEVGGPSALRLSGSAGYGRDEPLALQVDAVASAGWLDLVGLGGLESGTARLVGRVTGSRARPEPLATGTLENGRWPLPDSVPHVLDDIEASLRVTAEGLVLDRLRADFAGGTVEASGRSARPHVGDDVDGTPSGAWRHRYRLAGREMRVLAPEGWQLRGDADLVVANETEGFDVSGRATLSHAEYRADLPVGFAQVVSRLLARQRLAVEDTASVWSRARLDVAVETTGLRVRNNLANLTGDAGLVLRGTLAQPVVFGTVDIDAGSELVYNGTEYEIRRGRLSFTDPGRLDPEVDLEATTRIREFDVHLALSGRLERMDARFSSEPPLPDLDVFQLLAGGEPVDTVASTVVQQATDPAAASGASAARFLYGQAASLVGERVGALFGFDTFRIDPLTGSGDALSRARVTVGKQLTKDLSVTYSVDPASTEEQRLQVEWQVGRNLVLVLTQNGDETYAADLRWEQVF